MQWRGDILTRPAIALPSRRDIVRGLAGIGLGLAGLRLASGADARKKRKRKRKKRAPKATPNAFGCLEVGDPCQGADLCCSGICEGKKGKLRCRAHDVGTCTPQQPDWCSVASVADEDLEPTVCNDRQGLCMRTTANSNVCINFHVCADCRRDVDCAALGLPAGAVCAPFTGSGACAGFCTETGGMACFYFSPIDDTSLADGR